MKKLIDYTPSELKEIFQYKEGGLYWISSNTNRLKPGDKSGTIGVNGYRSVYFNGVMALEHRVIFLMHHGFLPKIVDHIDRNPQNNKIENLREATKSQNQVNSPLMKTNTSGEKNVCWDKRRLKWTVQVSYKSKQHHFGHFDDLELASLVATEVRDRFQEGFSCHA